MAVSIVFSCTRTNLNYTENGNWASRTTFGGGNGIGVGYAASFVIGNNAYVATGVNPQFPAQKLQAMWMYSPGAIPKGADGVDSPAAQGVWTAIANFPDLISTLSKLDSSSRLVRHTCVCASLRSPFANGWSPPQVNHLAMVGWMVSLPAQASLDLIRLRQLYSIIKLAAMALP